MKTQPRPPQKKKRPKYEFKKTANGFILNGKAVVVEYKPRREGVASPVTR